MIEFKVDNTDLAGIAAKLAGLSNTLPLMREIAGIMESAVEDNFAAQGRPKWMGLHPQTAAKRPGGKILQASGRLASSIVKAVDASSATVGTNVKYAAIHQFGGQTKPHVIRAKNKKALFFGGHFAKSVNHPGSKIPARPFLSLTATDMSEIEQAALNYLRTVIG